MAPSTPRRRNPRRGSEPETPQTPASRRKRLDGLWKDGQWYCNCQPRHEAVLRPVKKKGPNHGKFFWKCQVSPYCDFFLWRDEAKVREVGLATAGTPEPEEEEELAPLPKTPASTQRQLTSYGYSRRSDGSSSRGPQAGTVDNDQDELGRDTEATPSTMQASISPSLSKRKRDALEDDEFSDFGSEEEREMVEYADRSAEKAAQSRNAFVTPPPNRASDAMADHATSSVARQLFPGAAVSKKQKTVSFEDPETSLPTPGTTPHTTRTRATDTTTTTTTPSSRPDSNNDDIMLEIMNLLRNEKVNPTVMGQVREALSRAGRRTEGFVKGREAAREEAKKKDEAIAKLQARVTALDNKVKTQQNTLKEHHNQVTNMKAGLMKMYQDN